jgi:hypothetical protein
LSRSQIERLLDGLSLDQLGKAAEVAGLLLANISKQQAAEAGPAAVRSRGGKHV